MLLYCAGMRARGARAVAWNPASNTLIGIRRTWNCAMGAGVAQSISGTSKGWQKKQVGRIKSDEDSKYCLSLSMQGFLVWVSSVFFFFFFFLPGILLSFIVLCYRCVCERFRFVSSCAYSKYVEPAQRFCGCKYEANTLSYLHFLSFHNSTGTVVVTVTDHADAAKDAVC